MARRIGDIQRSAKRRGYEYQLSDATAEALVLSACHYCGAQPDPVNGIDRVNNSLGYEEGNVVTACSFCNQAKHTHSTDEFTAWIRRAARHMESSRNV